MKNYQLEPHRSDCNAFNQKPWLSPWSPIPVDSIFRGVSNPKRKGTYVWWVFRCNITNCPGKLAVRAFDFVDTLPWGVKEKGSRRSQQETKE